MFENFSTKFESVFRVIFIVWVCLWGGLDVATLLTKYASFDMNTIKMDDLGRWWLSTFGTLIGVVLGVLLLFLMASIPSRIAEQKPIKTITLMTVLTCFYYLTVTAIKIFTSLIFNSDPTQIIRELAFLSMWIMPSIIMLVIHMFYYTNLGVYNRELAADEKASKVA